METQRGTMAPSPRRGKPPHHREQRGSCRDESDCLAAINLVKASKDAPVK